MDKPVHRPLTAGVFAGRGPMPERGPKAQRMLPAVKLASGGRRMPPNPETPPPFASARNPGDPSTSLALQARFAQDDKAPARLAPASPAPAPRIEPTTGSSRGELCPIILLLYMLYICHRAL